MSADYEIPKEGQIECAIAPELLLISPGETWEGSQLALCHPNIHLLRRFPRAHDPKGRRWHPQEPTELIFLREDLRRLDLWTQENGNQIILVPEDLCGKTLPEGCAAPFYKGAAKQRSRAAIAENWEAIMVENAQQDRLVHWSLGGPALQDIACCLKAGIPLDAVHSFEHDPRTALAATLMAAQLKAVFPKTEILIHQGRIEDLAGEVIAKGKKKNLPSYLFLDTQNTMGIDFKLTLIRTLLEILRNRPAKYDTVPLRLDITIMRSRQDPDKSWEGLKVYNQCGEDINDGSGIQKARQILRLLNDYIRPERLVALPKRPPIAYQNEDGGAAMLYLSTQIEPASQAPRAQALISALELEN